MPASGHWTGVVWLRGGLRCKKTRLTHPSIAEHLVQLGEIKGKMKGKVADAHEVLPELLEEQLRLVFSTVLEKLLKIYDLEILRQPRRQCRDCSSLDAFEDFIEISHH